VTGASSGIGYELAKQFASHDFDLIVAAEDARIADVATELQGRASRLMPTARRLRCIGEWLNPGPARSDG